ncbi:MAG: glycosyltransferase family 4 protein [Alphaproteobacteria bacterium]|nr:glycosyltransferase family 4 protein [Alphaproteobacteria bacterium]
MKICQLCAVDFTMYHFLLPLMADLRDAGHEVVGVAAPGPLLIHVRSAGFRVETVAIERRYDLVAHWRAYRSLVDLFRRERFDVVHVHTPVAALIGRLAARRAGVPRIVYTAHGFYFHDNMAPLRRALFIALEWVGGRVTDVLMTQAEEDANAARRLRLCRGVIAAIGNGVDPARFASDGDTRRRPLRAELDTPADAVVVAVIGRLVAEKGYLDLLQAMRGIDAHLWIIGERLPSDHAGSVAAALAEAQDDPALAGRIHVLGYRGDVPDLLAASDIFTLPSHREGMPRSIIEAMMSGLPVIATDIRGSREEVIDGDTGILVPVADPDALAAALIRLIGDGGLRQRLGRAGRARAVALFDERQVIARQIEILGLAAATKAS